MATTSTTASQALPIVQAGIQQADAALYKANQTLHANPELAYKEYKAHDNLCELLEEQGFSVTRKAYDLETSFEASIGTGGREVIICAEYDALPEIGHACGHNLIATSSLAAFIGAARAKKELNLPGRLRLLGTPAEEGCGGKIVQIRRGAFQGASAAIMSHAITATGVSDDPEVSGSAAFDLIASIKFRVEFRGKSAHAAGEPWNGLNALDAAVAAYNNVSLLRQQIHTDERVHCVFEDGGTVPNVIPDYTRMNWYLRSPTIERGEVLRKRVEACINAGALATNCSVNYIKYGTPPKCDDISSGLLKLIFFCLLHRSDDYKNVVSNPTICRTYADMMGMMGHKVLSSQEKPFAASTDMGNVSHELPSMHGAFVIPTSPDAALHSTKFAAAAGEREAHEAATRCGTGMALLALTILMDDAVAEKMQSEFLAMKQSSS